MRPAGCGDGGAADDLEAVEKRIVEAWGKHKSMTAKITTANHMQAGDTTIDAKGEGTIETAREGDKQFIRMELKNTMVRKTGEQESKMDQPTTVIADGEFAYTTSEAMGRPMVVKTKIDSTMTGEPKAILDQFRKLYELKLMPEETLDGRKVFVIAGTPKEKAPVPGAPVKMVLNFDQEHGVLLKAAGLAEDGKPMSTMAYSDVKFDVKLDPDRFKFKAPEGVEIIDRASTKPE